MNRLTITPEIEQIAEDFAQDVEQKCKAISKLSELKRNIDNGSYSIIKKWHVGKKVRNHNITKEILCDYIEKIITKYKDLLIAHPKEFEKIIGDFNSILDSKFLNIKISYYNSAKAKRKTKKSFYELLVEKMGYSTLQSEIFPKYMRERLKIRTCVYCNSQFAIATDDKTALYQLDHCWPKSIYPFLCTSFFNLQPCCGSCNQRKKDNDDICGELSIWKEKDDTTEDLFHFHLDDSKLAEYLLKASSHDSTLLKISYVSEDNSEKVNKLHDKLEKMFHITDLYNQHVDIIEETIWRHVIYSDSYIEDLEKRFSLAFPDLKGQAYRIYKARYTKDDEIYRRPLTQMMNDIDKQIDS